MDDNDGSFSVPTSNSSFNSNHQTGSIASVSTTFYFSPFHSFNGLNESKSISIGVLHQSIGTKSFLSLLVGDLSIPENHSLEAKCEEKANHLTDPGPPLLSAADKGRHELSPNQLWPKYLDDHHAEHFQSGASDQQVNELDSCRTGQHEPKPVFLPTTHAGASYRGTLFCKKLWGLPPSSTDLIITRDDGKGEDIKSFKRKQQGNRE